MSFFSNLKSWKAGTKKDLNKSDYSIVGSDVGAGALLLWADLPAEVKYDPSLDVIRREYEREHGQENNSNSHINGSRRLPLVNSAPILGDKRKASKGKLHVFDIIEEDTALKNGMKVISPNEIRKKERIKQAKYYTKITVLLGCWTFFTAMFLMYNEKHVVVRNSSIQEGETKNYTLPLLGNDHSVLVKLSGPFLTENGEIKLNASSVERSRKMLVWLEKWTMKENGDENKSMITNRDIGYREFTKPWVIILQDEHLFDFSEGTRRSSVLKLKSNDNNVTSNARSTYAVRMNTTSTRTLPFAMSYTVDPLDGTTGVVYAVALLCGLYVLIIFEVINRTMAAITMSTMSLAVLSLAGERPSLPEVISWLEQETLLLLFSMMLLVAILAETGIFDYMAVFAFEVTRGRLWPLIYLLCATTGILSTFLDNVTTVLLMSPVTIRLCEVMDLDPVPILMFMAMYSNVGGTATPVGDPPNVIVASNKAVIEAGVNFTNFTAHMALGVILVSVQISLQIRYMFRDTSKLRLAEPREVQDIRNQLSIWRRAADSLPNLSKDVHVVRERLEKKITKMADQLNAALKESSKRACPKDTFQETLVELKEKYKIRDKKLLIKAAVATIFTVLVFFLHSIPELNRVSLGWTALLGAILLLILADREDLEPILHRVEWSTLLFFAALFVLMEALSKLGLIVYIGGLMEQLIMRVGEDYRLAVAILLTIWVSGIISACVDNIPLTTMMIRVVVAIGSNPNLNLPLTPLVWALLYGACLGGNGTLIGASANVVCAGVAEQHGYKFTFSRFLRVGAPVAVGHLIVTSVYLLIAHCVFSWH